MRDIDIVDSSLIQDSSEGQKLSAQEVKDKNELLSIILNIFEQSRSLKILEFSDSELYHIPKQIKSLLALEELNLEGNGLNKLPDWIKNCTNIRRLYLNGNNFRSMPECIFKVENLTELYMSKN